MAKFQSTMNPEQIIEVIGEMADVLRSPGQKGWKEYFEPMSEVVKVKEEPVSELPTISKPSAKTTKGNGSSKRKPK